MRHLVHSIVFLIFWISNRSIWTGLPGKNKHCQKANKKVTRKVTRKAIQKSHSKSHSKKSIKKSLKKVTPKSHSKSDSKIHSKSHSKSHSKVTLLFKFSKTFLVGHILWVKSSKCYIICVQSWPGIGVFLSNLQRM